MSYSYTTSSSKTVRHCSDVTNGILGLLLKMQVLIDHPETDRVIVELRIKRVSDGKKEDREEDSEELVQLFRE
mgnify:CR=1 FL=1|tara:strand:+ start:569 stop:787 length:219 start_codon:yes stop_codon:yes gene_type:complete